MRMARGYLKWSAKELAEHMGVAESTVKRIEAEDGFPSARASNIEAGYRVLAGAGIVFIPENGGGAGVRLKKA